MVGYHPWRLKGSIIKCKKGTHFIDHELARLRSFQQSYIESARFRYYLVLPYFDYFVSSPTGHFISYEIDAVYFIGMAR